MPLVSTAVEDRLGVIRLERPKAINALSLEMIETMAEALEVWGQNPGIGAVLLEGAGDKGFCAGGDVRAVRDMVLRGDLAGAENLFAAEYRLDQQLASFPKPVVALTHGVVMGGGIGLAGHVPYRFASLEARYAMPESAIGFIADVGVNAILARVPLERALLFILSGVAVGIADALKLGLADYVFPPGRRDAVRAGIKAAASDSQPDAALTRLMEQEGVEPGEAPFCALADNMTGRLAASSAQEVVDATAERAARNPAFAELARRLAQGSPTSLEASFQAHLRARRGLSLAQVLVDDLALARFAIRQPDFVEGVRAVLVDKDGLPRWSPERLGPEHRAAILRALSTS